MSENMPSPKMDIERVNEIKKASFWVSQFFILIATVVGVYLAATQGYKQAIQFENMTSYKNSYYLQKSLKYELQDNIAILKSTMEKLKDGSYYGVKSEPLNFNSLIWENMKFSPVTLETPPELLRQAQQFYQETALLHAKIAKGDFSVTEGVKRYQSLVDIVEQELIPNLDKNIDKISAELDGSDLIL